MLSFFSKAYPAVRLDIDFMDSEQAYELTLRGEVELAVVTLAPTPVDNIVARPIWPDPLDFMVQQGHELAQRKNLDLRELSKHPAILPGLNTYTGQIVKSLFDRRSLQDADSHFHQLSGNYPYDGISRTRLDCSAAQYARYVSGNTAHSRCAP